MGKNGNKEISGELMIERNDRMARSDDDNENENDNTGIGRTYECSFCKRGFTNAQALGGHMNIHRKDKAKAKHHHHPTFSSSSSINSYKLEDNRDSHYSSANITTPQWNHQEGFFNSTSIPKPSSQPSSYYRSNDIPIGKSSLFEMYDHLGTDLSLRINNSSSNRQEIQEKKGDNCDDDIDLELRLGYDP